MCLEGAKMKRYLMTAAAAAVVACVGTVSANAATLIDIYDKNDPFPDPLVLDKYGIDSPALYKCDVPDGALTCIDEYANGYSDGVFKVDFTDSTSGGWSWTASVADPVAPHYLVVKAGQLDNGGGWAVYELSVAEITGGAWNTLDLGGKGISHLSWYNTGIPKIPVPAAGLPMYHGR